MGASKMSHTLQECRITEKKNNSIARINNSQGWLWGEAPEITARQHTSTQLCAGTGQVSSFLSPPVFRVAMKRGLDVMVINKR
ncbi:hypothetical protein J6590_058865 [Homalodisca vitripennis]|nr:hypothetical protein J6590_058865 [Homalodisca vitripennis]